MTTGRNLLGGLGISALWLGAGCGGHTAPAASSPVAGTKTAPAASAPRAGAPCDLSGGGGVTDATPRVFIELALAEGDLMVILRDHPAGASDISSTGAFDALVSDPRLKGIRVLHVITPNDVPQTVPWELEGSEGAKERLDITVTPHVNGPAPEGVRVEIDVGGHAHTTVVVRDQQTTVFGGFSAPPLAELHAVFTLTPYVLWNEADLGRLLECKRRGAHPGPAASTLEPRPAGDIPDKHLSGAGAIQAP